MERPILLSKDIESKLALLDREVNYLLNKAKFAKPKAKAKAKNSTSSDKSSKANNTAEEKVIPPTEESTDTKNGGSKSKTVIMLHYCSLLNMKTELELSHQLLVYVSIQIQKVQRRCSRAKPRPLRRPLYTQTQTANHSPQKKQQLQVGLPNLLLMMPENFRGWTK